MCLIKGCDVELCKTLYFEVDKYFDMVYLFKDTSPKGIQCFKKSIKREK